MGKEVAEGPPEVGKHLLQELRVHLAQPCRLWLLLQRREACRQLLGRQGLARLAIVLSPLLQRPVPDKATSPGEPTQLLFLFSRRFKSISASFVHSHILSQANVPQVVSILRSEGAKACEALMSQG
jgi:hypothetical protein